MKALLIILLALSILPFQNCSKKKFSGNGVIVDPFNPTPIDPTPVDPTPIDPDCPRYLLVIRSVHSTKAKFNYVFKFDAEMEQTSTEGAIEFTFLQDGPNKNLTQCSGLYTNTNYGVGLYPLQLVEDLTSEIILHHGANCTPNTTRATYISVIDLATNKVMFDEKPLKDQFGCGYSYTNAGVSLNNTIVGIADSIANEKRNSCNK